MPKSALYLLMCEMALKARTMAIIWRLRNDRVIVKQAHSSIGGLMVRIHPQINPVQ